MSSQKVFIALLFLVGILFVVGINLGAGHNDNQTFQKPAWVSSLGGALAKPQPLTLADISPTPASCLGKGKLVVIVGQMCMFAIKQSSFTLRAVKLQLIQGAQAMVSLSQEQTLTVQQSLMGTNAMTQDNLKVYPGKAHGTLIIECTNAGNTPACQLELQ